jgi:hypothetical protein
MLVNLTSSSFIMLTNITPAGVQPAVVDHEGKGLFA